MKLSVLIPAYERTCYKLVEDLHRQLEQSGMAYEIIVAEDGSKDQVTIIANRRITELPNCRHIIRKENIGRAGIINFLISEAKGEWCIIMDSDAQVVTQDYISCYINNAKDDVDLVVGSLVNPDTLPAPNATLRYRYEKAAEPCRTAEYREHHPYERFTTFNFMGRRQVLLEVPFDERCTEYGFEDALMGIEMRRKGKRVKHIDNPLMHLGFESNAVFLNKTRTALRSLKKIEADMLPHTSLGKVINRLEQLHLISVVRITYSIVRPLLERNLQGQHPNLNVFAAYKLGYYLSLR